jgi:hypothetical protein
MMSFNHLALCLAILGALPVAAQEPPSAPEPIVERWVTLGTEKRRVSVFSDRVAVVSRHRAGVLDIYEQRRLGPTEYDILVSELERLTSKALVEEQRPPRPDAIARLHLGTGDSRHILIISPIDPAMLATGTLIATLDELERRVVEEPDGFAIPADWDPSIGDRVELANGTTGTIIDTNPSFMTVSIDDSPIHELIAWQVIEQGLRRVLDDVP